VKVLQALHAAEVVKVLQVLRDAEVMVVDDDGWMNDRWMNVRLYLQVDGVEDEAVARAGRGKCCIVVGAEDEAPARAR